MGNKSKGKKRGGEDGKGKERKRKKRWGLGKIKIVRSYTWCIATLAEDPVLMCSRPT